MGCIYKFTNKIDNKSYIGKTSRDVMDRHDAHIKGNGSKLLKRAIDKHGINNFYFTVIHDGILDIFLDDYEIEAIKKYNTVLPNGYNLTFGGEGGKKSEEVKRKISESQIGRIPWNKGKKGIYTNETRRKMSESHKGQKLPPRTEEHRRRLSESYKGFSGKSHTEETRRKMSESLKGEKHHKWIPEHNEIRDYFLSLPKGINIMQKRKMIYRKYSHIKPNTIRHWIRRWNKPNSHQ